MDVSDILFENLMIHPDKWFKKLDAMAIMALEQLIENSSQV